MIQRARSLQDASKLRRSAPKSGPTSPRNTSVSVTDSKRAALSSCKSNVSREGGGERGVDMVERREAERSAAVDAPVTPRSSTSVHAPQMYVSSLSSKSSPLRKKEMGAPSSPRGAVKNAPDSEYEYSSLRSQTQRAGQASVRERAMTSEGEGGGGEQPKSSLGEHGPSTPPECA